jgi:hypothetical protein
MPTPWPAPNIINHQPQNAPPYQGVAPGGVLGGQLPQAVPQAYVPGPAVTRVNSTQDPRIVWEDGYVAIIYAKDFPANSGMGRSKTRKDIKDALNAAVDDQLVTPPGANSAHDFVKVKLADLLARPLQLNPAMAPQLPKRLPISPREFMPVTPKIAQTGRYKGHIIPDFPHDCQLCGGKYYQGAVEAVHPTQDGKCPALSGKGVSARRR